MKKGDPKKYKRRHYDKAAVKAFVMEHYPYDEIIAAFEKVDFDLEEFFITKANDVIQEVDFYISIYIEFKDDDLTEYYVDLANGYWEIPEAPFSVAEICRQLFFCVTENDFWDFLYNYCPAKTTAQIYRCYVGTCQIEDFYPVYLKAPEKADRMINFLLDKYRNKTK